MSYPFVQAYHDYGVAKGPRLGITWHMAEGGWTVAYLAKPNPNGVSVHFVVERDGDIVQMLKLDHANGSIRPTAIRATDDKPFTFNGYEITYGASAAKAVLGVWWKDPNSATIGVEVEGYARDGPNVRQAVAMGRLWEDLSSTFPEIRSLAHRDFASYKSCPGKHVPWDLLGGHGEEAPMLDIITEAYVRVRVAKGAKVYDLNGIATGTTLDSDLERDALHLVQVPGGARQYYMLRLPGGGEGPDVGLARLADCTVVGSGCPEPTPCPEPDCDEAIEQAIERDRQNARIVWA